MTWDPPQRLDYLTTYAGGDAHTSYQLAEGDGVTTLVCESDTDWARPEGLWDPRSIGGRRSAGGGPRDGRRAARQAGGQARRRVFDGMAQGQMQAALDASLQKLKSLIEAARSDRPQRTDCKELLAKMLCKGIFAV